MLRGIWLRCVLTVLTVLLGTPVMILSLLVPRWSNVVVRAGRVWSRALLATAGARVTFSGIEHAYEHSPCVFIANHQSIVDIWVIMSFVPTNTRFVAKQELFRIPLFGWVLRATGFVPINRGNRAEAIRGLRVAADRVRAGRSVVLFPEGSRSRDGSLGSFKKGAFHLAVHAGVPVVPVAITGSFDVVPPGTLRVRPGPVDVFVEPAIDVAPFRPNRQNDLLAAVYATIASRLEGPRGEPEDDTVAQESS